jgi:hypothetical protein
MFVLVMVRGEISFSQTVTHDHPLHLACPGVLSPVGELLSGVGWGFIELCKVLGVFFFAYDLVAPLLLG